ncbi:unnamed protein product [Prorocentrum cordatum]|uniref:Uncharacterized protein n=1 Tax=Prorocentrum cordatum TaxID=2364126 RepID=A0ABN9WWR1_9DINO|nr:unnamed protein product [Polarella glacialis]
MIAFESPAAPDLDWDAAFVKGHRALAWLANDSSKPMRSRVPDCWMAFSTLEWAQGGWTKHDVEAALVKEVCKLLGQLTGRSPPKVVFAQAGRWGNSTASCLSGAEPVGEFPARCLAQDRGGPPAGDCLGARGRHGRLRGLGRGLLRVRRLRRWRRTGRRDSAARWHAWWHAHVQARQSRRRRPAEQGVQDRPGQRGRLHPGGVRRLLRSGEWKRNWDAAKASSVVASERPGPAPEGAGADDRPGSAARGGRRRWNRAVGA